MRGDCMSKWFIVSLVSLELSLVIIITWFYIRVNKELMQKNFKFEQWERKFIYLQKSLEQYKRKQRLSLTLDTNECRFQIIKIGDENTQTLRNRLGTGFIESINFEELTLEVPYNLPIQKKFIVSIHFNLDNYDVRLKGILKHKKEIVNHDNFIYLVKFIDIDNRQYYQFSKLLRMKELEQRRRVIQ